MIFPFLFGCQPNHQSAFNNGSKKLNTSSIEISEEASERHNYVQAQTELETHPLISSEETARIKPAIQKWLDFYGIDLTQARLIRYQSNVCLNCAPERNLYFRQFTRKDDASKLIAVDYSPDKQRYIDLGILYENRDNQLYSVGWDDSQQIYLTDRKAKHHNMVLWLGSSVFAEAAFWQNNDVFVIVGYNATSSSAKHFIDVFDIRKKSINHYEMMVNSGMHNQTDKVFDYMGQVNMKDKGIIIEE